LQFPHLSDTSFPDLKTVNVYQFRNTFDYSRWTEKTLIKLCNVLWNSSYSDVVKFDTDELRDSWFDSLNDSWTLELRQAASIVPEGYVKLPIPYDVMARYNYLYIDIPIITSSDAPIDYENPNGLKRWYFFINNIRYLSPSATQVYIDLDIWTNFQNNIDIPYMLLERGHAPVAASNTDTYLANPIANNRYLLAPDVNFDNAGITRSGTFVPFGNGNKYVCFATTVSPDLISTLGAVTENSAYNPTGNITYSDVNARYGHQLQVNGLSVGNGRDYSQANTPAKVGFSDGKIANNLTVYAIAASECYGNGTFFADILSTCPQFLTTVQACFVVDEACITLGRSYTIAGHTIYKCVGKKSTLLTKALSKTDFNYPQELQRFAKLYTAPYAQLEITDNDGNTYKVNIEETTTLSVKAVVSIAFPYINERIYIEGIGGVGSESYSWVDLNGNTSQLNMPNSDWFKYCFDWKIPTFALYMNGETAFQLESFNRNVKQAIQQSIVNYHVSMRSANTAYENACDQADVAYTNTVNNAATGRDNSYRSADTAKTNTDALADTQHTNSYNTANTNKTNANNAAVTEKQNADNRAQTEKTNADNSADAYHTNAYNVADTIYNNNDRTCTTLSDNVALSNTGTAYNEEMGITESDNITNLHNQANSNAVLYGNRMLYYTTDVNIEKATATAMITAFGDIGSAALSGSVAGAVSMAGIGAAAGSAAGTVAPGLGNVLGAGGGAVGGAVIGGLTGAVGGAISAVANNQSVGVTTNSNQQITDAQAAYNTNTNSANISFANDIQDAKDALRRAIYRENATIAVGLQNNSNTTSRANAAADRTTAKTNATTTRDTTKANATNSKNTANTNAANTKNTADTNAANTATMLKDNADNTQAVTKTNATNTKNTSRANALDTYNTTAANAGRTQTNVKDNAGYTRQVAELNAKEILENGRYASMAAVLDARNSAPTECCPASGNPAPDYMQTRGIQIKVKTQSDSAIRQTGDIFARFGYTLNQIWDVASSGLKLMHHFTYWKAAEIWVDDREASNNAVNTFIRNMFLNGVTVWNNPTEIGKINVYAN